MGGGILLEPDKMMKNKLDFSYYKTKFNLSSSNLKIIKLIFESINYCIDENYDIIEENFNNFNEARDNGEKGDEFLNETGTLGDFKFILYKTEVNENVPVKKLRILNELVRVFNLDKKIYDNYISYRNYKSLVEIDIETKNNINECIITINEQALDN